MTLRSSSDTSLRLESVHEAKTRFAKSLCGEVGKVSGYHQSGTHRCTHLRSCGHSVFPSAIACGLRARVLCSRWCEERASATHAQHAHAALAHAALQPEILVRVAWQARRNGRQGAARQRQKNTLYEMQAVSGRVFLHSLHYHRKQPRLILIEVRVVATSTRALRKNCRSSRVAPRVTCSPLRRRGAARRPASHWRAPRAGRSQLSKERPLDAHCAHIPLTHPPCRRRPHANSQSKSLARRQTSDQASTS